MFNVSHSESRGRFAESYKEKIETYKEQDYFGVLDKITPLIVELTERFNENDNVAVTVAGKNDVNDVGAGMALAININVKP